MARPTTKKPSAKSTKQPVSRKPATRARPAPKPRAAAPKPKAKRSRPLSIDTHPSYVRLAETLKPGRYARGLIYITEPGALDDVMSEWLMGKVEGRRSIGRTAFGEILVFRDLRARARELGTGDPEKESDVALIDINYKKMKVLSADVTGFLDTLESPHFQRTFLRKELYEAVRARVGPPTDTECYGFVPALALGGSEEVNGVQRVDWRVYQAIVLQA